MIVIMYSLGNLNMLVFSAEKIKLQQSEVNANILY